MVLVLVTVLLLQRDTMSKTTNERKHLNCSLLTTNFRVVTEGSRRHGTGAVAERFTAMGFGQGVLEGWGLGLAFEISKPTQWTLAGFR